MQLEKLISSCVLPVKFVTDGKDVVANYNRHTKMIGVTNMFFRDSNQIEILLHEVMHAVIFEGYPKADIELNLAWDLLETKELFSFMSYTDIYQKALGKEFDKAMRWGIKTFILYANIFIREALQFFDEDVREFVSSHYKRMIQKDFTYHKELIEALQSDTTE